MNNVVNLRCLQLKERKALMELVTRLHENFSHIIRHILLFGSKVRGSSSAESDIDLLIVVEEYDWALEKEITRLVTQTDYAYEVILSDHIISNARFKQMAARREPLYRTLEVEGIDLWMLEPQSII